VVPDIVTVGKPLGNGFPLGAVITSREIAYSLGEYMTTVRNCVTVISKRGLGSFNMISTTVWGKPGGLQYRYCRLGSHQERKIDFVYPLCRQVYAGRISATL